MGSPNGVPGRVAPRLPAVLSLLPAIALTPCRAQSAAPLATVPLEPYLRAQAVVRASVNGHPGTFLFDTGQGVSSISPAFAAKIGCRPWGRITGFRMSGERVNNPHCDGVSFNLSGREFLAPVVSTVDVMTFIGPDAPPVDGAVGLDIFANRAITIVPRQSIILESAGSSAARSAGAREL